MHAADVRDAFHMLSDFLTEDEHYLASSQAYGDLGVQGEDGRKVIFGVRPENLDLAGNGNGLPASVVVVEPTGADTQVYAKFRATDITAVFRERHGFQVGETISLAPVRAHLFDAESGATLTQ